MSLPIGHLKGGAYYHLADSEGLAACSPMPWRVLGEGDGDRIHACPRCFFPDARPLKMWARARAASAIRQGLLVRQPCEQCGATGPETIHAHHDDYTEPLLVRWLCRRCHSAFHATHTSVGTSYIAAWEVFFDRVAS